MTATTDFSFERVSVVDIAAMAPAARDALPYGVIGLDQEGLAQIYNQTEARMAGLDPQKVIGRHFFDSIAQCMNNFMVAQRFEDEVELDEVLPYVLTLRMRPTPVRLRLLASGRTPLRYILIER